MKFTAATIAALAGVAAAAKDSRTFAVLHFNGKELTKGRMDPIVNPGQVSSHVHSIMGGSGFSKSATGEDLIKSKCSNANVKGDYSAYWFPSLYFHDPKTGKFESVDLYYFNAYYFFEPTNDDIKAFPLGLSMVSGDAMTRVLPAAGVNANLDPSKGPINPARMTCPRKSYNPPSWDPKSDGSMEGVGDPNNLGEGVGFPDRTCDGLYSPLRADVHFPSCYNPKAGLTNYKNNMVFPSDNNGKQDCPPGYIHVPHIFFESYWDTQPFQGRWEEGKDDQPFVFSNGDVTGYSSHADFLAGWDEDLLQHIIDTCDAGDSGMDKCPGLFYGTNSEECHIESEVDEVVDGTLTKLPGNNPLSGFKYGNSVSGNSAGNSAGSSKPSSTTKKASSVANAASSTSHKAAMQQSTTRAASKPTQTAKAVASSHGNVSSKHPVANSQTKAAQPATLSGHHAQPTACTQKVHTVWKTVTVTAPAPSQTKHHKRGHIHRHAHARAHQ